MANEGDIIKEIRQKIPSFECKEGCSECCGPAPFSKWEWEQIKDKREATSIHCPYIGKDGCEIYGDRPIICRLFGAVRALECPHGCKPLMGFLSDVEELQIMRTYLPLTI